MTYVGAVIKAFISWLFLSVCRRWRRLSVSQHHILVPETPTPEQIAANAKREEYTRASEQTIGNGISSVHKEIFVKVVETFAKIRQLLVEPTVDTLNEAFLDAL